jgi:hypothetical protein
VEMAKVAVRPEVCNEEVGIETIGVLEGRYEDRHLAVGRRRHSKKTDQGGLWVPEDVGLLPQTDDPTRRSCTAQGTPS